MKNLLFVASFILALVAKAQISNSNIHCDSICVKKNGDTTKLAFGYSPTCGDNDFGPVSDGDSIIFFYSQWIPNYVFPFDINGNQPYSVTSSQLDSCKGIYTYVLEVPFEYASVGIGVDVGQSFCVIPRPITSITTAYAQNKTGTVSIYDMLGRFVKTSPVSEYTQGLNPGQLYIYTALYSDGTADAGKFVIQ